MYPVINLLNQDKDIEHKICISGQHEDLINQMLEIFKLKADYKLEVMQDKQPIEELFGKIIREISLIIEKYNPNLIVVHGDTLTTFATTIAGFFKKIDVAHVEAGLRTNNIYSPWPEEANRRLTAVLAKYHFAPTEKSSQNLIKEGINPERILVTGNTIVDMVNKVTREIEVKGKDTGVFKKLDFINENKKIILVTCHRRENIGEGIKNICKAIIRISQLKMNLEIIIPVHHNPYIKNTIVEYLGNKNNINLIEPLDYFSFVNLMYQSTLILTDSGGIQEEIFTLKKPALILRESSEREEIEKYESVKLVGASEEIIFNKAFEMLSNIEKYRNSFPVKNPYGDGKASERIHDFLKKLRYN